MSSARSFLPNEIERILRDYYAGKLGNADLEERLLRDVKEDHFRAICQNALEGLATKKLNLEMLIERQAQAQERRVVPETIARFIKDAAPLVPLTLKTFATLPYTFEPDGDAAGSSPIREATGLEMPADCCEVSPVLDRSGDRRHQQS